VPPSVPGLTVPEIARKYGRPEKTVRWWMFRYEWPAPVRKLGGRDLYDEADVDRAVREILRLGDVDADMGELLDAKGAAAEAGISWGTVRADVSRGRWPEPDDVRDGVKLWKRSTVRAEVASRRPSSRRARREP
jgi:hypothetical protein